MFIEERNNTWNSPYLFNGKELDEETGLYYYGARYYNPRESVWLSVDPLAEKYPNVSPYAYTFQNPIRYTDPTGMEPSDPPIGWFINYQGFIQSSSSPIHGWTYVGDTKPDVSSYRELERINGNLYHKNTDAWVKRYWNKTFGTNFVEKKQYDSASENFFSETESMLYWMLAFKAAGIGLKYAGVGMGNVVKLTGFQVDLFGGTVSKFKGFINYDIGAKVGIADDVANFGKWFGSGSVKNIIANNPQADFLKHILPSLENGGTVTIRGTMSNKFFNKIWRGSAEGLEHYKVMGKTENVINQGYKTTGGKPIQGQINEIILQKK